MAMKCVHKGCGKKFTDENEPCTYHPGPPVFHEGQKGWKCCKPRVLEFDQFLEIPPCTVGKHSTVDDTPAPEPKPAASGPAATLKTTADGVEGVEPTFAQVAPRIPTSATPNRAASPAPPPESDSDEPSVAVPPKTTCKRRGCGHVSADAPSGSRDDEKCVYHPGQALFHEGSKGWTCCKKRVLEFDEFMKIPGCKTRSRHCFVGKKGAKRKTGGAGADDFEKVETVRHDFYQTPSLVHASLYLKKVDKDKSTVAFNADGTSLKLDLKTSDGKRYQADVPLYGSIKPAESSFVVKGTKVDLTLAKKDGLGWPVLRADEKLTGEIIQTGRAGRA